MIVKVVGKQEVLGTGKPDFSRDVSSALSRAGIRLKYNQGLKIFALVFTDSPSIFPWVRAPLAPGASAHLIDQETGDETPYNLSAGYTMAIVSIRMDLSEDFRFEIIYDSFPTTGGVIIGGVHEGGIPVWVEEVLSFTTALIDPRASKPHTLGYVITNLGAADLCGHIGKLGLLEAVGTAPLATTKTTRCPFCSNKEVKPVTATEIICSACGKLYIVYNLSRIKGSS